MAKISDFQNDYIGLSSTELSETKEMFGKNSYISSMRSYTWKRYIKMALRPFILILILCSLICLFGGELLSGLTALLLAFLYNTADFFINKKISDDAENLHDKSIRDVRVVREGVLTEIPSDCLLPGDIIVLSAGEVVPADSTVLEEHELTIDEAVLTDEHISVIKNSEQDNSDKKLKSNYIYSGSIVTSGEVVAKVFAIGKRTMCARNKKIRIGSPLRPTKSERKSNILRKRLDFISIIPFIICFFVLYFVKAANNAVDPAIYSTALSLSLVPALLPLLISSIMSADINHLSTKKRNIINYSAFEKAGGVSVICVDKTGVITANQPKISEIYTENKQLFAHISTLACDKENPSQIDDIILRFCEDVGADVPVIQSNYLLHTFPFDSSLKISAFVWKINSNALLCAKGSPEEILRICRLSDTEKAIIKSKQEDFAKRGLSVIAVAFKELSKNKSFSSSLHKENELNFAGLYAISDPPRDSITDAVENCKANGIKLMMITGDNPDTALSVAASIGLDTSNGMVSGETVANCSNEELAELISTVNVFARVSPELKFKIVNAIKASHKKVCIVGENTSDVPVLQAANVGICIGENPSDYAKEACDIWIENNSLDEITDTVIYCKKNRFAILKSSAFALIFQITLFVSNLVSLLFASKSSIVQVEFMPAAIALIEALVFCMTLVLFSDYKGRVPRISKKKKTFSFLTVVPYTVSLILISTLSYKLFLGSAHLDNISTNIDTAFGSARCFSLVIMTVSILFGAFAIISDDYFALTSFIKSITRPRVASTLGVIVLLLITIAFVPAIGSVFCLSPISVPAFLLAIAIALIPPLIVDIFKTLTK